MTSIPTTLSTLPAVKPLSRIASKAATIQDLGAPHGPERTLIDGVTTYQSYANGAIFSSPAYGTFSVPAAVDAKWQQCAQEITSNRESVQDYLGAPVQDPLNVKGGGVAVYFERGMITVRPDKRAFATYGAIYLRYRSFGDVTSFLGFPAADEEPAGRGRRSTFDEGEICWRADLGAFETHGAIHARFEALGGPAKFGFPVTNETQVLQNRKEIGRYNNFENGKSIYWSPMSGAWDVNGPIKGEWDNLGGPHGPLGFPVSGETDTPAAHFPGALNDDAGGRYNNFQKGIIVWHASGPYAQAWPVFNLRFYVDSFTSDFNPIHVQAKVHSSYGQGFEDWFPSSNDYSSNPRVEKDLMVIPVVHGDLNIDVWFDGLGRHDAGPFHGVGADERLGIYQATYNISNLWGLLEPKAPDHAPNQNQDSKHSFDCKFKIQTDWPKTPGVPWRKQYWWPFDNFGTAQLSWSQYAQTFTDVHDDESVVWHPFDHAFYSLAYQGLASNGNCFGMCLESIYAQYHRSIYSEPLFNNPYNQFSQALVAGGKPGAGDGTLTNDINIKHGYQIGADVINYFLGKFVSGGTHDPVRCFKESLASFQGGDMPLISVSQDSSFGGGHVLRPYRWNSKSNPWTIEVANPNTPASTLPDPDGNAPTDVIKIDPIANTFTVNESLGTTYTGSASSGGRMFSIPYSVMSSPPCTPIWEVLSLLAAGTLILTGDGGQTKQITDESGHTYLTPQGTINEDAKTRIPNFAPVPLLHSGAAPLAKPPQIHYMQRPPVIPQLAVPTPPKDPGAHAEEAAASRPAGPEPGRELAAPAIHHEVTAPNGGSYQWGMRTAAMSVVVQAPGSPTGHSDLVSIDSPGRPTQAVTVSVAKGGASKTASVHVVGPTMSGAANARLFEIANLPLTAEQGVTLSLDDGGGDLLLHNHGPQASISLRVQSGTQAANSASRPSVTLEAGMIHRITPSDWTPSKIATAPIGLQVTDKIGGAVIKKTEL